MGEYTTILADPAVERKMLAPQGIFRGSGNGKVQAAAKWAAAISANDRGRHSGNITGGGIARE